MTKREVVGATIAIGVIVGLLSWLLLEWALPSNVPLRKVEFPQEVKAMTTVVEGKVGYYRYDFMLTESPEQALLQVVSDGGFELMCNGNPVGANSHWRPTRPFQNGLTEWGQRLHHSSPAMALNFAREYQWEDYGYDKIAVLFDLRSFLREGKNTLCLTTEGRAVKQSVKLYGEVKQSHENIMSFSSGSQWKAETIPKGHDAFSWAVPEAAVTEWQNAREISKDFSRVYTLVPEGMFESGFSAPYIQLRDRDSQGGLVRHKGYFTIGRGVKNAVLKVAADQSFMVKVNGKILTALPGEQEPFWFLEWSGRAPLGRSTALLDPDEATEYFGGSAFLDPRHGDPTQNDFQRTELTLNRTSDRPNSDEASQQAGSESTATKGRVSEFGSEIQEPNQRIPLALTQPVNQSRLRAFGIQALLKKGGKNELEIILPKKEGLYKKGQGKRLAYQIESGGEMLLTSAESGLPVLAKVSESTTPRMKFVSSALPARKHKGIALLLGLGAAFWAYSAKVKKVPFWILTYALCLLLGCFLKSCFYELGEQIWFRHRHWVVILFFSCALLTMLSHLIGRLKLRRHLALIGLLLITFMVRVWHLDFQPIDDDEYASIQAALSIAEKGVPEIAPGIYYSRSPVYHYLAGLTAWIFGGSLLSLRTLSAAAAVLTAWYLYRIGKEVFRSEKLALLPVLLFALHPFLIFTGHLARFYQFQQLFLVMTLFYFLRGFLFGLDRRAQVAAVLCFGGAVLSQEISLVLTIPLVITWLIFGQKLTFIKSIPLMGVVMLLGGVIALDVVAFKILCMTRGVGVSPNVEATLAPNFWQPHNLFSMLIANSRLHLMLSFFALLSLAFSLQLRDRKMLTLHLFMLFGVLSANFLITSVSFRYQYTLIPLWMLLAVHGVRSASRLLSELSSYRKSNNVLASVMVAFILLSWCPWRIPGSYGDKLLGDSISSLRYVKGNWQDGDQLMITEPHPHAALSEVGQVDYDLSVPILYDFSYNNNGLLRDRNGNAEVVNRLGRIQEIIAENDRLWVVVNREKFRSRKKNIRWEYPGARIELFFRKNFQLAHRSYLWDVYLWDRSAGKYTSFRKESNSWVE